MKEREIPEFVVDKAIEIYASNPMVQHQDVAKILDISEKKLRKIRRNGDFQNKVYEYYMKTFDTDVVAVLKSMIKEAISGNTTAGRIVLEHSGRLQNNVNIHVVKSPFQLMVEASVLSGRTTQKQADQVLKEVESRNYNYEKRYEDVVSNPNKDDVVEYVQKKEETKKEDWNARRRELHKWKLRAKAVNIEPLPKHRVTKGQRAEWEQSIIEAEQRES
tara:strand:- start:184 stop:837 length:654 start_codon:yes stop_codon:yes gene_type:complete